MSNPVVQALAARGRSALRALKEAPSRFARTTREQLLALRHYRALDWAELASALVVTLVFALWLRDWTRGNVPALFDPKLTADDARTAIFPFHRYEKGAPLANDPIATEMLEYQPYCYRLIFRLFVPLVGLLYTTKIVQALLFGLIAAAGVVLARSRRAGLGAGLLFVFFFFRDQYVQNRILGGLPRGFGFPLAALWIAGAVAERPNPRRAAALIAALTYPTALAMVLAAEGLYAVRRLGFPGWRTAWRRLRHYAYLVAACGALLAPAVFVGMSNGGPIHTLEQARREPAFSGRLHVLPFGDPGKEFGTVVSEVLGHYREGESPFPAVKAELDEYEHEIGVALLALFLLLPLLGWSMSPGAVARFFVADLILYALSRFFAFRLYSPERFYSVGMRAVVLALAATAMGLVAPALATPWRRITRNLTSAVVLAFVWVGIGDGVRDPSMGATIDYRREAPLWDFIKKLPLDARIASHIEDGDTIPLFAARATNGTSETLQPWLTLSWKRQKIRAEDTLRAMYATDPEVVLAFARKYHVTHLLVNRSRYRDDFRQHAKSFEPFTSFTSVLLSGRSLQNLVLASVPASAVVFRFHQWQLVDVAKLEQAWSHGAPGTAPEQAPAGDDEQNDDGSE
ncbi:MAG TPA: hypothetical protein VMI54_06610 [Polyangiaceae bacterium]|nr:hypothetical protein [Polyangiaceae bacterium]